MHDIRTREAVRTPYLSLSATAATTYFLWRYFFPRQARGEIDTLLELDRHERILIIAPHSDDEALACGGLLHQAVAKGKRVEVVVVTNGDGFALATGRAYRRFRASPERFLQFGEMRQGESLQACSFLGLPEGQVHFLGYPDRGIRSMWLDHWSEDRPFRSPFTKVTRVPYERSLRRGAPYAGEALVEDLLEILFRLSPTLIIGPHLNDAHIDHWSTHNFVRYALALYTLSTSTVPTYLGYLVHRGNWPAPKGLHRNKPLVPPASMIKRGWEWQWYSLDPQSIRQKYEAILLYRSQIALMRRYMLSFVRVNELFAPHSLAELSDVGGIPDLQEWEYTDIRLLNPVKDTVVRRLQGAADVVGIDLCFGDRRLLIRVDLRTHVGRDILYRLHLRMVRPLRWTGKGLRSMVCSAKVQGARRVEVTMQTQPSGYEREAGSINVDYHKNSLLFAIPVELLEPRAPFLIGVGTWYGGLAADLTGWQLYSWPLEILQTATTSR